MGQTFSLLSLQFFVFRFTFFFFFYFFFFHIDFCSLSFNRFLKMTLIVVISVLASALMTMGTNSAAAYDYDPNAGQQIVPPPSFLPGFAPKPGMTYPPVKWECPWYFSCANPENQNRKTTCCDNDCQCVRIGKKLEKKENKLAQLLKERRRIRQ